MKYLTPRMIRLTPEPSEKLNFPRYAVHIGEVTPVPEGKTIVEYNDGLAGAFEPEHFYLLVESDQEGRLKVWHIPKKLVKLT